MWREDARNLAQKYLASNHAKRWKHVQAVGARAQLIRSATVDDPVVAAAWLHDIGYATCIACTGLHALDGASFLAREGAPPLVVSLVAYHTGAEFEAEERGLSDRLEEFARPPQNLLDVLILCDLTVSPSGDDTVVADRIAEIVARYGDSDPVHRAVLRSSDYLRACCARAANRTSAEERGVTVF